MLTIRTATEADAPGVASIIGLSFRKQAELLGISRIEYPNYVAFETDVGVRRRLDSGAHVAMGYCGDEVIGTVTCVRRADELPEISRLAVLPPHRGSGYGRELMTYAENTLAAAGARVVEISIVAKFRRLQDYYERLGYSVRILERASSLPFELAYMQKVVRK